MLQKGGFPLAAKEDEEPMTQSEFDERGFRWKSGLSGQHSVTQCVIFHAMVIS